VGELIERFIVTDYLDSMWLIEVAQCTLCPAPMTYGYSLEFGGRNAFVD
jgi:hypothetical protein